MSGFKKIALAIVGGSILVAGMVVVDWYRFTTSAVLSPSEGVFGNDHLEVWIDINAHMPTPLRVWACKTLLDREAAVMGGVGAVPPHSCQPDFGAYDDLSQADGIILGIAKSTQAMAVPKGATEVQQAQIVDCVRADMTAALTPDQRAGLGGELTSDLLMAVNTIGQTVGTACMEKVGLK